MSKITFSLEEQEIDGITVQIYRQKHHEHSVQYVWLAELVDISRTTLGVYGGRNPPIRESLRTVLELGLTTQPSEDVDPSLTADILSLSLSRLIQHKFIQITEYPLIPDPPIGQMSQEEGIQQTLDALDALFQSWIEEYGEEEMAEGARFIEETFGA